ncbi:MAG: CzcE family metal-binding protein [Caldimonas sp.]
MTKSKQGTMVAAFATAATLTLLVGCASSRPANYSLGTPAEGHSYDRKVVIRANTKFVNVDAGEMIRFIVQEPDGADRSFTWHFDIFRETVGDLSTIAPAGVLDRQVKVIVGPNPLF